MRPIVVLALLAAVSLSGCELRLGTDIAVDADGAGSFELLIALDPELHELLLDAGMDPLRGLDELHTVAPDWRVERQDTDDGGLSLSLMSRFDGPAAFARTTDELHDVLDAEDGRLWDRLRLTVDDAGVRFDGQAGLVPPTFPGADGPVSFDEEDLAALIEERGDEFVRYELRVSLPGEITSHDADRVEGNTLTWELPVGELRPVSATSEFVVAGTPLLLTAIALVVAAATAVSIVAVRARRRSAQLRQRVR